MFESQRKKACITKKDDVLANNAITCSHYPNKQCSKFYFSCCDTFDPCHICHQEKMTNCNKPVIHSIECSECGTRQSPSASCTNCSTQFDKYYCDICKIWSEKDCYHCNDCGLCRQGTLDNSRHCHDCNVCFESNSFDCHPCIKRSIINDNCSVCCVPVHASRECVLITKCKHLVHENCFRTMVSNKNLKCPMCRKYLCDLESQKNDSAYLRSLIASQPITQEHLPPIMVGNIVDSIQGDFIVRHIHTNKPSSPVSSDIFREPMYEGELIVQNGTTIPMTFFHREVKKKLTKKIFCFECEKKSITNFHFIGLECKNCGSFNTSLD